MIMSRRNGFEIPFQAIFPRSEPVVPASGNYFLSVPPESCFVSVSKAFFYTSDMVL